MSDTALVFRRVSLVHQTVIFLSCRLYTRRKYAYGRQLGRGSDIFFQPIPFLKKKKTLRLTLHTTCLLERRLVNSRHDHSYISKDKNAAQHRRWELSDSPSPPTAQRLYTYVKGRERRMHTGDAWNACADVWSSSYQLGV